VSEYSFFLFNPQAAWIASADHQIGDISLQKRGELRRLFFSAEPDEKTAALGIVPNVGSRVCVSHGSDSDSLGLVSTSFAAIGDRISPIDQDVEINVQQDFFNDIFTLRGVKLHLHIKCGAALTDTADFKELPIIWFRISQLPTPAPSTKKFFK
jgi:hypothetical protein